jgi:hypothetical protein
MEEMSPEKLTNKSREKGFLRQRRPPKRHPRKRTLGMR